MLEIVPVYALTDDPEIFLMKINPEEMVVKGLKYNYKSKELRILYVEPPKPKPKKPAPKKKAAPKKKKG